MNTISIIVIYFIIAKIVVDILDDYDVFGQWCEDNFDKAIATIVLPIILFFLIINFIAQAIQHLFRLLGNGIITIYQNNKNRN